MENQVRFKIGEIEFEAKGAGEIIERERNYFVDSILPAAIDAIVRTRGQSQGKQYIEALENKQLLPVQTIETDKIITANGEVDLSRTSLASYVKGFGVLEEQDFALIAAYYDEKKNGTPMFSLTNIKQYYMEARRSEYSNYSELLKQLTKKGFIMDAPNPEIKKPRQYILTSDGITYVESYKPKDITEKRKAPSKSKKARNKIDSIYSELCADDLNLKNYPEVKLQNSFKEKMILVLYIVTNEKKGEFFSVTDVQYLMTDVLGLPATVDQVNGVFKHNKSWFKSEQDSDNKKALKRKLLEGAKEFAKGIIAETK